VGPWFSPLMIRLAFLPLAVRRRTRTADSSLWVPALSGE